MLKRSFRQVLLFLLLALPAARLAAQSAVKPDSALAAYLGNGDYTYNWELKETLPANRMTVYHLLLTSQKWHDAVWTHQLSVIVPDRVDNEQVLLMITGGSTTAGQPEWREGASERLLAPLGEIAVRNRAVAALVRQVPNQPLYDSLKEDALISYTLHRYRQDGDATWPLLFPMTKSAVRAMDAVTEFCAEQLGQRVAGFVVTGASKRGWTTWLAASQDDRVIAAAPMVIDVLNMPRSIQYQIEAFGGYSEQIRDYADLGILQSFSTPEGEAIVTMIDPYSYRRSLTMPKLLLMGTNDPYWVTDNVKNYLDSIPGQNFLHYIPNAGHDLRGGDEAMRTLGGFFSTLLTHEPFPACDYLTRSDGRALTITVGVDAGRLKQAELWSAVSPTRDFRQAEWSSSPLAKPERDELVVSVPYPADGYSAFYIDLTYTAPNGQDYKLSTRVFMTDKGQLL